MQTVPPLSVDSALSTEESAVLALELLRKNGIAAAADALEMVAGQSDASGGDDGQIVVAEVLALLLDALADDDVATAASAIKGCSRQAAAAAHDVLLRAFFPDGMVEPDELDDAALLCLALLKEATHARADAAELIDRALLLRHRPGFIVAAEQVRGIVGTSQDQAFRPKLVIWDLDDTLWHGTLADGDAIRLNEARAGFVRALNARGIVSAICSKNEFEAACTALERFRLWDEFVFPRIAFVPKGEAVKRQIADMQLRPANVLFIDDNPHNLEEVAAAVPGIRTVDARSAECDRLLRNIVDLQPDIGKSRVADYRALQARTEEREQSALSNEAFLRQCDINAVVTRWMDNLDFVERIEELVNRSNSSTTRRHASRRERWPDASWTSAIMIRAASSSGTNMATMALSASRWSSRRPRR